MRFRMLDGSSVSTETYEYAGPSECELQPGFVRLGCPTMVHHRPDGGGVLEFDQRFFYAADGRVVRAEAVNPNTSAVTHTWTFYYRRGERHASRVVGRGSSDEAITSCRYTADEIICDEKRLGAVVETTTYKLDKAGNVAASSSTSTTGDALATGHYMYDKGRLTKVAYEYPGGHAAEEVLAFACHK
jgi:hypothetical protein